MLKAFVALVAILMLGGVAYFILHHKAISYDISMLVADGKVSVFKDKETVEHLEDHGPHITAEGRKSFEIVNNVGKSDVVILGSDYLVKMLEKKLGRRLNSKLVFKTFTILLAWDEGVEALKNKGWVRQENGIDYMSGFPKLVDADVKNQPWSSIGLPYYGLVKIEAPDPQQSTGGLAAAVLVAQTYLGEQTLVGKDNASLFMPQVVQFFKNMGGSMRGSSGDLFNAYIHGNKAEHVFVLCYESQIVEWAEAHPQDWAKYKSQIRFVYPEPTIASNQYAVALTPEGDKFLEVLDLEDTHKVMWDRHGLRYGVGGSIGDPSMQLGVKIASQVQKLAQVPDDATLDMIRDTLKNPQSLPVAISSPTTKPSVQVK